MPRPARALRRLRDPLGSLLLVSMLYLRWADLGAWIGDASTASSWNQARPLASGLVWASGGWLLIRLVDLFVWDAIVAARLGGTVPGLLKNAGAAIVSLLALGGFLNLALGFPVAGIWATSGVVGLVVGLALQSLISDFFSGIAINVDRPFVIGDWILLNVRGLEPMIGCVMEVNWRSTRIRTTGNVVHIVPNTLLSGIVVTNLSSPDPKSRFELFFTLDPSVPSERALRILNAGVKTAAGILQEPAPKARIERISELGVEYSVRYWLLPREFSPSKARHAVCTSILAHLHRAGLSLALPKRDVFVSEMPERAPSLDSDLGALVRRGTLFRALTFDESELLATRIVERSFAAGETVVSAGAPGHSMFLVAEGYLTVFIGVPGRDETMKVGRVEAGECFGEMTLLTAAPRSATVIAATDCVCYEVDRSDLAGLLDARPELAARLSEIVAEREATNSLAQDQALLPAQREERVRTLAGQILGRMQRFFSVSA